MSRRCSVTYCSSSWIGTSTGFGSAKAACRIPAERYYVPDIVVVPTEAGRAFRGSPGTLPVFRDPAQLVVEVWSPSTGDFDVDCKIPEYKARGDHEIWRLHPFDRTLTAWRRQPDGSYVETIHREGVVNPRQVAERGDRSGRALPGLTSPRRRLRIDNLAHIPEPQRFRSPPERRTSDPLRSAAPDRPLAGAGRYAGERIGATAWLAPGPVLGFGTR